jgi:carboxypeptidase Taq
VSYRALADHYRRINHLAHVSRIAAWDEAVMMPTGGGEARAQAMATLEGVLHELGTDARIPAWIAAAEAEPFAAASRASLREIKRVHARATALPQRLVEEESRAQLRCEQAWRTQRSASDFPGHRPLLEDVVRLKREEAQILSARAGLAPYDALMDAFEPGMRATRLDGIFQELERSLPGLVDAAISNQAAARVRTPKGPFAIEDQKRLGLTLMTAVGFDFDHGRLDTSHHPFCGGVPEDVRITTRYDVNDFTESLMGVLHETGHAKYEQGLPRELCDLPVGQARSMALHESQSLFWEMQVCRGRPFLTFAEPHVRRAFAAQAEVDSEAFAADNLARLYARVERSYIRVDADEVTYPLHVILRYRIERDLVDGSLEVRDLPERWDADMQRMLGLSTGNNHRDGCMQDVHWASGAIGYFPSYTLGALIAAQLFDAARAALPDLEAQIARGDFSLLNALLRERIWSKASLLETDELIAQATGGPLGTEAFLGHVQGRCMGQGP